MDNGEYDGNDLQGTNLLIILGVCTLGAVVFALLCWLT